VLEGFIEVSSVVVTVEHTGLGEYGAGEVHYVGDYHVRYTLVAVGWYVADGYGLVAVVVVGGVEVRDGYVVVSCPCFAE